MMLQETYNKRKKSAKRKAQRQFRKAWIEEARKGVDWYYGYAFEAGVKFVLKYAKKNIMP